MPHTNEKVCMTVGVCLIRDGKALLVYHPKYERWLSIGGHMEPGEDPTETLYREIYEEAGFTRDEVELIGTDIDRRVPADDGVSLPPPVYLDRHPAGDREHFGLIYFARVLTDRDAILSDEHGKIQWFTADELKNHHVSEGKLWDRMAWYNREAIRRSAE